jgi:squalene monooxygenase
VIGSGPPILLYQIDTHETRILIDIPTAGYEAVSKDKGVKSYIREHIIPILPQHARPMVGTALRDGRLRSMPNTWLPPSTNKTPRVIILGHAMSMRHPLTGGGMTIALKDVVLLGDTRAVLEQMPKFH